MRTTRHQHLTKMVKWILPFYLFILLPVALHAQIGTWRAYMSYYEPQQIVKGGHQLFVRASNDLYSYNLNDHSITTYDKVNALSDTYITHIAWNNATGRLIIVYQNSNIDLMDDEGNVQNISALYAKSMTQDKTVNTIYINDVYAYLGTGFGVVKVNMKRAEIAESYILNENISDISIGTTNIYVRSTQGKVLTALLTSNLIDSHNWTPSDATADLFTNDLTDWNDNIDLVNTLNPGGPKHNYFGFMRLKNGKIYSCGTGYDQLYDLMRPATVQLLDIESKEWTMLPDDIKGVDGAEASNWMFVDMMSVDVDPLDDDHIFASGRPGVFEYNDGQFVKYYHKDNSILQTATTSNRYVLTESVAYDAEGNLWMLQSQVTENSIVELTKDGEWISHKQPVLMNGGKSLNALQALSIDSRGLIWFVNNHSDTPSIYCYDPKTDQIINSFKTIINQDGTSYSEYAPYCAVEDLDNNMWIGTNRGLFLLEANRIYDSEPYLTQVKVPRNDGSNYADYLMNGAVVNCIVIDGGNRKWLGTKGSGIYLISADNMTQLQNFTTENSPLFSNNVESMAINNETGELFIGTESGLCSYMTDATTASIEMTKDNVYAYPNPVVSDYDGLITIVGLSMDADVKILSASGQLVAQGRSNGGTFTWNGRDRSGRRVASGVYMVATATSDGKKGTVCKIAVIN